MGEILEVKYENKFCYNILIEKNWDKFVENLIMIYPEKPHKICIVTDSNVAPLYLSSLYKLLSDEFNDVLTFEFPAGESNKTLQNIMRLYDVLISKKMQRGDLLIALGGGVVGDMTGFAAATFLRGIDFIQIPTTLLSQVDSSIGGKTGVDFNDYKNMIGAFHMPRLVYINTSVLNSLPKEQFLSGMGEVIKHGLIRNKEYFDWIIDKKEDILALETSAITKMILESCKIKRDVVEEDPTEKGIRAILNFGHTAGHAIEKCKEYSLFHGYCVSIGAVCAAYLSVKKGLISKDDFESIKKCFMDFDMPISTEGVSPKEVFNATKSDKKMVGNAVKFVLLDGIGNAFVDRSINDDQLLEAIETVIG